MEETSSATSPTISSSAPTNPGDSDVPRDLRDWLARAETIGQIKRITQTVDHDSQTRVNANRGSGDDVDVPISPAARHWAGDGGRYIGTADAIITRDPDAGWLNVGCYRQMIQDKTHVGLYCSPGKDARLHIERYWSRNEPCEIVAAWGVDPAMFVAASLTFPKPVSELDFIGGIAG